MATPSNPVPPAQGQQPAGGGQPTGPSAILSALRSVDRQAAQVAQSFPSLKPFMLQINKILNQAAAAAMQSQQAPPQPPPQM